MTVATFVAWATAQRPPRLYRIALVAPFEGLYRETGYAALDALRQQVSSLNEGPAGGRVQFQVWAVDDGNDPSLARRRALELAADPLVLLVVGHYTPETSAAAAATYADAGLVLVSPLALAGAEATAATAMSVAPPPTALVDVMSIWLGSGGRLFANGEPLWPATAPSDALGTGRLALNGSLLSLEWALVETDATPASVLLPYDYCPDALLRLAPDTSFSIAAGAGTDGTVTAATGRAAALATRLIERAIGEGEVSRQAISAAAQALRAADGWQQYGPGWYAPAVAANVIPCPPPG
ncbi:MAG: ABC transporter substrate-binding protein [Anaerolineae bacterium]